MYGLHPNCVESLLHLMLLGTEALNICKQNYSFCVQILFTHGGFKYRAEPVQLMFNMAYLFWQFPKEDHMI